MANMKTHLVFFFFTFVAIGLTISLPESGAASNPAEKPKKSLNTSAPKIKPAPTPTNAVETPMVDPLHLPWDQLLKRHVRVHSPFNQVSYVGFKKDSKELSVYLQTLEQVSKEKYQSFSANERLAFLINAYNAWTIQLIVKNYPVKSIKDTGSFFRGPWKQKFFNLFGELSHLDRIEHEILRKEFQEPRIHFAIVCASKGCPPLRNEAYIASRVEDQLENQTKAFLKETERNRFDGKTLFLSSIFKWFSGDFEKKSGSVRNFVGQWMGKDEKEIAQIKNEMTPIQFLDYDWTLNEVPGDQ